MAGANIQFRPKGLGTEKRTRAGVRKAGQPSEGKLEEGRGGANWAEGWQEIFKRHIKRKAAIVTPRSQKERVTQKGNGYCAECY